jgi:hypothetical protein
MPGLSQNIEIPGILGQLLPVYVLQAPPATAASSSSDISRKFGFSTSLAYY